MIKKIVLLPILLFGLSPFLHACDACGCSIGGNGIGLLTAYRTNFVGLGWQWSGFRSAPGHGFGSSDDFQNLELSVRYHLSDRFKLLLYQPYSLNRRVNLDESVQHQNGFSDTRLLGSYTLVRDRMLGPRTLLFVELGAGVKLPTGRYDAHIHDHNLPENFNPGNGSWGFILQPAVMLSHRQVGVVLGGRYQHHAPTSTDYRFGHQLSAQMLFYGEIGLGKQFKVVPNGGLNWENITTDRYANGNTVSGTGGRGAFLSGGLNLTAGKWIVGAATSLPVSQSYSHDEVEARPRLSAQLSFTF